MTEYLKLPLKFKDFFQQEKLPRCSLKESIFRNLHLLITTHLEENKQDPSYGSVFWEFDYDIHLSNDARREIVITTLKNQITDYEKRIINPIVEVNVKQMESRISNLKQIKRRLEIIISGKLIRSNEPIKFQTGFFIGPLLFD